jgi:hypothetical protein
MSEPQTLSAGKPIDQGELLDALAADGLIDAADARRLRYAPRTREGVARHPVNFVADQQLVSPADARPLGVERLLGWLAQRTGQAVYHIDPLRIDVSAVTSVMSFAFAQVATASSPSSARDDEVVIAGAEPLVDAWEADLARTLKRPLRRVSPTPKTSTATCRRVLQPCQVRQRCQREMRGAQPPPGSRTSSSWSSSARSRIRTRTTSTS